jgi:hypothetical protein
MKEEFVTYEQALALKELGFDEPCMFVHDTWGNTKNWTEDGEGEHRNSDKNASIYYSAPLKQQVFRWFREKHDINNCISYSRLEDNNWYYQYYKSGLDGGFKTYEEAENACLNKLIKLVKNKTDEKNNNTDNNSNSRLHL